MELMRSLLYPIMDINIDIHCTTNMWDAFCSAYGLNKKADIKTTFETFFDNLKKDSNEQFKSLAKQLPSVDNAYIKSPDELNKSVNTTNIKIGDVLRVAYVPFSQRFIEYYESQNVMGYVFYVNMLLDNMFMFYVKHEDDKKILVITSLERESCSYLGDSRGYVPLIYK